MTNVIVTTTINAPTEALRRFNDMPGWHLIVVGDLKTPAFDLPGCTYLSPEDQQRIDPELSELIGWNSIRRRSLGFLVAHKEAAHVVATVDDDNIPYDGWGTDLLVGRDVEVGFYDTELPAFDPVGATNYPQLWHRGFPIQFLAQRHYGSARRATVRCDVQADFWDGDPDIDAICRMEHAPDCTFDAAPFPLASNKIAPFNSQNTFLDAAVLPHYFMFPHVGRMDDIWAAFHVQGQGYRVVFQRASVRQERNPHDLTIDFRDEILGYEWNYRIVEEICTNRDAVIDRLPERSAAAFRRYQSHFD